MNLGGHRRGSPPGPGRYFAPWDNPRLDAGASGEFLTDRLAAETADFVRSRAGEPFFAVMSLYSVHIPLMAPADLVAKYEERARAAAASGAVGPEFLEDEQVWPTDTPPRPGWLLPEPSHAAGGHDGLGESLAAVLRASRHPGERAPSRGSGLTVSETGSYGRALPDGAPPDSRPRPGRVC